MRVTSEYVIAMHDYEPQQPNTTCLSFRTGNIIHVLNRDPSGWWDGEFEGRRGWFPSNYVNADPGKPKVSAVQVSASLFSFVSLFLTIHFPACSTHTQFIFSIRNMDGCRITETESTIF